MKEVDYRRAVSGLMAAFYRQTLQLSQGKRKRTDRKQEIDLPWSQVEHYIDEWIHSESARQMLKAKLHNEDITFEELSEQHNMAVQSVKKKYYKAVERLYSKIPSEHLKAL